MSSGNEYDALGRILSEGGDTAVVRGILGGKSGGALASLVLGRFPSLSPSQQKTLIGMAQAQVEAGESIDASDPTSQISLAGIPVNPNLFGDDSAGRRLRVGTEFYDAGLDRWYTVYVDLADVESRAEAEQRVIDEAKRIAENYPQAFGGVGVGNLQIEMVRFTFAVRRF